MPVKLTEYMVVCQQVITTPGTGFEIVYGCDGERFSDRKAAIKHGFEARGSDDFNIAVVKGMTLISFDWMDEPVGEDDDALAEIASQLFLRPAGRAALEKHEP